MALLRWTRLMLAGRALRRSLALLAALVSIVVLQWNARAGNQPPLDKVAVDLVSERSGVPASSLRIASAGFIQDAGIARFKVVDQSDGTVYEANLDLQGRPVSDDAVAQAIAAVNGRDVRGKLESELADRLDGSAAGDMFNVGIWARSRPTRKVADRPTTREEDIALNNTIGTEVADLLSPILRYIDNSGIRLLYQSEYTPLVFVEASKAQIEELAGVDQVGMIFVERVHQPRLDISKQVIEAHIPKSVGIEGSGVLAGVLEAGHPQLDHVFLGEIIRCLPENNTSVSGHQTRVAGVIRSLHEIFNGVAPGASLISGNATNFSQSQLVAASDCLRTQLVPTINMSFGSETNGAFDAFARYVDDLVYNFGSAVNVAVSNFCANRMGSPEIAFNANAVGAFDDRNTVDFSDDGHPCAPGDGGFSAYRNPISPNDDREEPDIVAPGAGIMTTTLDGMTAEPGSSGTSYAAPHVTGTTALMFQRDPELAFQAERTRAILMASSWHNIEGDPRLSDRDGAGAILASKADEVLTDGLSSFFVRPGGTVEFPIDTPLFVSAGQQVRVAIAWAHKADVITTEPSTDLDLELLDPDGSLLAMSASYDNNYEIVLFTAPVDGKYTIRITNSRSSDGSEFIGQAISFQ